MGLIVAPLDKKLEERVARDINRLFNLFLPEVKTTIKADRPKSIYLEEADAICLFYCLQGELVNPRDSRIAEARASEADFWQTERITIWTTEAWLLFLAMEFVDSGKTQMINDLMKDFFPKIFVPSILYGRDALEILERVEAKLPSGREIPEEAEELLMLL